MRFAHARWAEEHADLVRAHGDERIRQDTFDALQGRGGEVVEVRDANRCLVGVSAYVEESPVVVCSLTVIATAYRDRGLGTRLMRKKLALVQAQGCTLRTMIAADNQASLGAAARAGLGNSVVIVSPGHRDKS